MTQNNIEFENCKIVFRNFSGKEGKFNPPGRRNFCVVVEPDLAERLEQDGWNIRWPKEQNEDGDLKPLLQVAVSYDNIPPKIWMMTKQNRTLLNEDTIGELDFAEIEKVDLIVRPYNWEVSGKSGVKAYVKSMFVSIIEDRFESKYAEMYNDEGDIPLF